MQDLVSSTHSSGPHGLCARSHGHTHYHPLRCYDHRSILVVPDLSCSLLWLWHNGILNGKFWQGARALTKYNSQCLPPFALITLWCILCDLICISHFGIALTYTHLQLTYTCSFISYTTVKWKAGLLTLWVTFSFMMSYLVLDGFF